MVRRRNVVALVALVGVGLAVGCGTSAAPAPEPSARASTPIQDGTTDSSHTFALGMYGEQQGGMVYCSATLIAPNLVLTARHCLAPFSEGALVCPGDDAGPVTTFGAPAAPGALRVTTSTQMAGATAWYTAREVVTPPDTTYCGNDLALLILSRNVPASEATPAIPSIAYDLRDHEHVSTSQVEIGYGVTAPDRNDPGTRRALQNVPIRCIPDDPTPLFDCYRMGWAAQIMRSEYVASGTCPGDSGSGGYDQRLFAAGKYVQLGVLSRGVTDSNTGRCEVGLYTRVDSWRDLIIETAKRAAELGGYTAPDWVDTPAIPALPDGGAPRSDAGDDAGDATTSPSSGGLGSPCVTNDECLSGNCSSYASGPFVCTQGCDDARTCPAGYVCRSQYCFADPGRPQNQPGGSGGGCAAAPRRDPTKPVPWIVGAALAIGAAARRRRK